MSEDSTITFASGAAGQSGVGMEADLEVVSGAVTTASITDQGSGYAINDVFLVDDADVGSNGGSGFTYQLSQIIQVFLQ